MDAIVDPNSGLASEAALRDTYVAQLEAFMAETRVLTAERVSLGDTKTDRQRKAAITEQLADLKGNTDAIQLCIALEKECAHFRDRLLKQPKAMKAEHEAAKQQQQQQQQQRPHSSLNISGAGVRSLPCTRTPSSADISGGCGAAAATYA